jgi:dTDP-4-amino-4,6-dideoxygalactose transaminase
MQQSKVLTSGEGGAVVTSDASLYDSLQQYRADGRRYVKNRIPGGAELDYAGLVQGHNYCLSEFHSAVLLDRLRFLDKENTTRYNNVIFLTKSLRKMDGVLPLHDIDAEGRPTFYRYFLRLDLVALSGLPIETIAAALTAELGLPVQPIYEPLNRSPLFNPRKSPRRPRSSDSVGEYNSARFSLPVAEAARRNCLTIPHNVLLGGSREVADIVHAIEKNIDHQEELLDTTQCTYSQ